MPLLYTLFTIYFLGLEFSCFLVGGLLLRKYWAFEYKLLVALSGLTFLVESFVEIIILTHWFSYLPVYGLFLPFECLLILYIFYRLALHPVTRRLNLIFLGLLPIGIVLLYWLYPHFSGYNEPVIIFYLFLQLISASSLLIDILMDSSDTTIIHRPQFWMVFGMIVYCTIITVAHIAALFFLRRLPLMYYKISAVVANTFMYVGFITSFIVLHRQSRKSMLVQGR